MRDSDDRLAAWFNYASCEARVPADHPLRIVRAAVDEALDVLSPVFSWLDGHGGGADIAPRKLLRALMLQALFSIRSEQRLLEQLDYNLLFRWFVGLSMEAPVWEAAVFADNRARLLAGGVAQPMLAALIGRRRVQDLLPNEQFRLDTALIQSWASYKPPAKPEPEDPTRTLRMRPLAEPRHQETIHPAFSSMPGVA